MPRRHRRTGRQEAGGRRQEAGGRRDGAFFEPTALVALDALAPEPGRAFVDAVAADEPGLPPVGVERSGSGREFGRHGLDGSGHRRLIRVAGRAPDPAQG
ncbi:hypothetical protein ACFQ8C_29045, partial [Streptomyces sp. NPDC056503]